MSDGHDPPVRTITWAPWVYGEDGVPLDDPAETFHEASKLSPVALGRGGPGAHLLERSLELQASTVRAVKRHPAAPRVGLPDPAPLALPLRTALQRRRSAREFATAALGGAELAALVEAATGLTHEGPDGRPLRAAPSAGALYPLELYVAVERVADLAAGLYHVDPLRADLELLRAGAVSADLAAASPYPELFAGAAVVLVLAGVFWRSRFKYGLRGYRFTLLEAGHVAQNVLLSSAALGLVAVPVGGFYDRALDRLLGLDGVDESSLYAVSVGRPARG